jgi:hypothetical protein
MVTMPRHPKAALVEAALERAGKNPSWLARALGESKQKVYKWLTDTLPRDDAVFDRMLELIPAPPEPNVTVVRRGDAGRLTQMMQAGDLAVLPVWRAVAGNVLTEAPLSRNVIVPQSAYTWREAVFVQSMSTTGTGARALPLYSSTLTRSILMPVGASWNSLSALGPEGGDADRVAGGRGGSVLA